METLINPNCLTTGRQGSLPTMQFRQLCGFGHVFQPQLVLFFQKEQECVDIKPFCSLCCHRHHNDACDYKWGDRTYFEE